MKPLRDPVHQVMVDLVGVELPRFGPVNAARPSDHRAAIS
jgi:hypothetical protein